MSERSIDRIAWRLLNDEFHPDDDTYKGVSKDIHNAALEAGWVLADDRRARDERIAADAADELAHAALLHRIGKLPTWSDFVAEVQRIIIAAAEADQ